MELSPMMGTAGEKSNALTAKDEEAKSVAYIQKLLAREQRYMQEYGNYDYDLEEEKQTLSEDDDYIPSGAKKRLQRRPNSTGTTPNGSLKKKNVGEKVEDTLNASDLSPSLKENTVDESENTFKRGPWSELEEGRFLDGLETYGRQWKKLVEFIGTRDYEAVRSHTQKHFIKLFRSGQPLPEKVKESGMGYTLSGLPLDPESAAAKPYLNGRDPKLFAQQPELLITRKASSDEKETEPISSPNEKDFSKIIGKKSKKAKRKPIREEDFIIHDTSEASGELYKERLRRQQSTYNSINFSQLTAEADPHTLVRCTPYTTKQHDLSGIGTQPFALKVSPDALVVMDFHAHLLWREVIGFLAGCWDKKHRGTAVIHVHAAFPCKSIHTECDHVNVELDPEAELEVRRKIKEMNLTIVGWYHSHPVFQPDPSLVDLENQKNYQTLFKDDETGEAPYVGAIVAPYDPRLPEAISAINWFHVCTVNPELGQPKHLKLDFLATDELCEETKFTMLTLAEQCKHDEDRVHLDGLWGQTPHLTRLQKTFISLKARMPWLISLGEKIEEHRDSSSPSLRIDEKSIDSWFEQIIVPILLNAVSKEQS